MNRLLSIFEQAFTRILVVLNLISVLVIFLMALWVFCDVAGRFIFNCPIPGTTELVKCYIVATVFLGIAYTMNQQRHIRTTLIVERLPPLWRAWSEVLASLIAMAIFGALCYFAFQEAMSSWDVREFDGVQLRVPVYPARFTVVLGSGLLVIQNLIDILHQLDMLRILHERKKT